MNSPNSRKLVTAAVVSAVVLVCATVLTGQQSRTVEAQPTRAQAMEMKLTLTQELLEKITLEEFDEIVTLSDTLFKVSVDATWVEPRTKEYDHYVNDFFHRAVKMEDEAREGNLEAVTLHYTNLIRTCVQCHEVVRKQQDFARLIDP